MTGMVGKLKNLKLIAKGAEADIYEGAYAGVRAIFKCRNTKAYRTQKLDEQIRAMRTRKEARLLHHAKAGGVWCPLVLFVGKYEIVMEHMDGRLMKDIKIDEGLAGNVGKLLAQLHDAGVAHGDFTPANVMVLKEEGGGAHAHEYKVAAIDFGLGDYTRDDEERATDLLLMKKSLAKPAYVQFISAYCKGRAKDAKATLERLEEIEKRGRYVARGALA